MSTENTDRGIRSLPPATTRAEKGEDPRCLAGAQCEVAPKPTPQLRKGRKEITVQTLSTGQLALHAGRPLAQSLRETFFVPYQMLGDADGGRRVEHDVRHAVLEGGVVVLLGRVVPDHDRRAHGPEVVQVPAIAPARAAREVRQDPVLGVVDGGGVFGLLRTPVFEFR